MQPIEPLNNVPRPEVSTAELVREAMSGAKKLIQIEVELAKNEIKQELLAARSGAIAFLVSAVVLVLGLALMLVSIALAIFPGPIPALLLGLVLIVASALGASVGVRLLPRKPLETTRRRLETDIEMVKERVGQSRMADGPQELTQTGQTR